MIKKFLTFFDEHKNVLTVFLTLLFILLFLLFYMTYNSKENIAKRNLKSISKDISNVNSNLAKCIKDLTIDTNTSKEVLLAGVDSLKGILQSIDDVPDVNPNIALAKDSLSNAINSTLDLYSSSLIVLSDSKSIRTNDDLNKFNTIKENCILDYSNLNNIGITLTFSESSLKFFDNFYNYMNALIKINKDSDFNASQKREFINTLQSFNKNFEYLNEDLTLAIDKVREDNRDLIVIIDDLLKKEELFNTLKQKSFLLSIPDGCNDIYESLNEYLTSYPIYLNAIKEAVIYEKTSDTDKDISSEIDKYYKNSSSKRDDVLNFFKIYEDKLKNN